MSFNGGVLHLWCTYLDSDLKWIRQRFYQFFIHEKLKKNILYFSTWVLSNHVPHEITKEFWKYDSWFCSEVSKLASVRNKLFMSFKYWFMEAKYVFRSCNGPKKLPKYHLKTILTTFSQRNKYNGAILVKINFCPAWKCMISGIFHRTGFWQLWRKSAVIFSKWMFFQNSLVISLAI